MKLIKKGQVAMRNDLADAGRDCHCNHQRQ